MGKKQKKKTKIPTSIEDYTQYEMLLGTLQPDGKRQFELIRKFVGQFNPMPEDKKIASIVVENINNPKLFIESIKENPDLIFDEATKATITFLRFMCSFGNEDLIEWAKEILKAVSLGIFIPKRPNRRPDSQWISYWKIKLNELEKLVETYETEISSFTNWYKTWKDNEPEFKQYYQDKYKRVIPNDLLKGIKLAGSKTDIALLFIADEYRTNSPSIPDEDEGTYRKRLAELIEVKNYPPHSPSLHDLYYNTRNKK